MSNFVKNPCFKDAILPVEVVFHPSWWFKNTGITFDEDFFYHPSKRVESEKRMEEELYNRFGMYGLGRDRKKELPVVGAVHNAAGYLISEMLGCKVGYFEDSAPQVYPANHEDLKIYTDDIFGTRIFKKVENLLDKLKSKYGYLYGDINWGGILNSALDLQSEKIFIDFFDKPEETRDYFRKIAKVIEQFTTFIARETGTTSVSVNRLVYHFDKPVFLHSECSHTMISVEDYENFLLPFDIEWSRKFRPFGVHYCGVDPDRMAESFAKIPDLDFLDVGWGGDVKILRKYLPGTFLNIRLSPVEIINQTNDEIRETITRLVNDSGNPFLTGVCCINMDDKVEDGKVMEIFKTVEDLRNKYRTG
ncbi:MAG TPA: hypothetical protein DDW27_21540 [Bacteroidales bacterium]|nr:hypothetical protein [Bacteroidales bacterium]